MAGQNRVGRPRTDDPKMTTPNYTLKQSTIIDIDVLADELNTSRSNLLQTIIENGINTIKMLKLKK